MKYGKKVERAFVLFLEPRRQKIAAWSVLVLGLVIMSTNLPACSDDRLDAIRSANHSINPSHLNLHLEILSIPLHLKNLETVSIHNRKHVY